MKKIKFLVPLSMVLVMYGSLSSLQAFETIHDEIQYDNSVKIGNVENYSDDWVDSIHNQYFGTNFHYDKNAKVAKWPYENNTQVSPAYVDENYQTWQNVRKIHGSPIAIQFNPDKSGSIKVDHFILRDKNGTIVETELAKDNLNDREYAIVPKHRLDWDSKYSVNFAYHEDGVAKTENWIFTTQKLNHPIYKLDNHTQIHDVAKSSTYAFYIGNSNVDIDASFQHNGGFSEETTIDHDTFYAKVDADVGTNSTATINGEHHKFHIFTNEVKKLEFSHIGNNSVTLKWYHDKSGEEKGYKIYRDGKFIARVSANTSIYTDKNVKPGINYKYTIKVTNDS